MSTVHSTVVAHHVHIVVDSKCCRQRTLDHSTRCTLTFGASLISVCTGARRSSLYLGTDFDMLLLGAKLRQHTVSPRSIFLSSCRDSFLL